MKRIFEIKRADFEKILFIHFYPHVVNNRPFFFHKVPLASSMCLFMWIKVDKYDFLKIALSDIKNSFNLESYNFLAYLECFRSYAWSKGHSDPDLSSVGPLFDL